MELYDFLRLSLGLIQILEDVEEQQEALAHAILETGSIAPDPDQRESLGNDLALIERQLDDALDLLAQMHAFPVCS